VTLWETIVAGDYLMIGSRSPVVIDYPLFKKRCQRNMVAFDLERINMDAEKILSCFVMDQEVIRRVVGDGPLHTDDLRQLEFEMPRLALSASQKHRMDTIDQILKQHVDVTRIARFPDNREGEAVKRRLMEIDRHRDSIYEAMKRELDSSAR
jgi:hypothetical protein